MSIRLIRHAPCRDDRVAIRQRAGATPPQLHTSRSADLHAASWRATRNDMPCTAGTFFA